MNYDHILIRYAELSLKGKNRKAFEQKLESNIRKILKPFPEIKVKRSFGRMFVELNGEDEKSVSKKLKHVFGIQSFSPALKAALNEQDICTGALWAVKDSLSSGKGTFKVSVRRVNKDFPVKSQEMNHVVGSHVLRHLPEISVNVHEPDVEVKVEIRHEAAYISAKVTRGAGGLPVGTSGKVMLMLSGGIDSPVAGYLALKRGVTLEAVHFHSPPFTNERAKQKVEDLVKVLTQYGGTVKLHVVPFTDIQTTIHKQVPDNYEMTIMRRMMLRITGHLVKNHNGRAIVNGENLGQVASQTLDSMHAINDVTSLPVLRPLVTMDKTEVMEYARRIGTYDISIRPYEDCCTIFLPAESKTRPSIEKSERYESFLDIDGMVNDAVDRTVIETYESNSDVNEEFEELF